MDFLNSKQRKHFFKELEELYGYTGSTDYAVYEGGKEKFYLISRDLDRIPFEELRIRQGGLHVASGSKSGLRLTMDGAQLFGPDCADTAKVTVSDEERDAWMAGQDIPADGEAGWTIIHWRGDILGCGYRKEGVIRNYVPKERRIQDPHEY